MPSDFEQLKIQFLADIQTIVMMEDIPAELVINWDQSMCMFLIGHLKKKARKGLRLLVLMTKSRLLSCYCVPLLESTADSNYL